MSGQYFQTTLTFVDSVSEVYSALLAARPLVVFPKKVTRNVEAFIEGLESTGITRLFAVTSLIRGILSVLRMEKKRGTETNIRLKKVGSGMNDPCLARIIEKISLVTLKRRMTNGVFFSRQKRSTNGRHRQRR